MRSSLKLAAAAVIVVSSISASFAPVARADAPRPLATDKDKDAVQLKLLGETADAVVNGDDLKDVRDKLAASDRDRVKKSLDAKHDDLNKLTKAFRDAWHDKYGKAFNASDHVGVLQSNRVEHKENNGKEYAHVFFDKSADASAFEVHLVRDGGDWRVSIPDDLTGDKLVDRLTSAVKKLVDSKDKWPKEESPAYDLATSALLHPFHTSETTTDKPKK